jgi:hypothetical protein
MSDIESLKKELIKLKFDCLKTSMKNQTLNRIQYGELYKAFAEALCEIESLKAELRYKSKKRNIALMNLNNMYDQPDCWNSLE